MTENSLNSFWSSSILISVIIGGCVLLLMYIIRLFKNDNQKGKVTSVKNVTRHSEKEPSSKGKKKSTETKWAARVDKQHSYTHPWLLTTLKGHTGHVLDMDFSSNGKYLASCAEEPDPGGFADIDTSSSTSSSLEDAPVDAIHLHSGPGQLNSKEVLSTVRKPGLSRRQRKNRRREDSLPADRKKNNRRCSNHSNMFEPLRQHVQLNMQDAQLTVLLKSYQLPVLLMRRLSFPFECPIYHGRVIILKNQELPDISNNNNNLQQQQQQPQQEQQQQQEQWQQEQWQQQWPQLPFQANNLEFQAGFDVNAREFIPSEPGSYFFYNAQTCFYGMNQELYKQTSNMIEVRQYLHKLQPSDMNNSNSSDEDFSQHSIPSAVYTRSTQDCAIVKNPRPIENARYPRNNSSPKAVFKKSVWQAAEDNNCGNCKKPKSTNNGSGQKNSANLVLSPRSIFKQSVWQAAEDVCTCPEPAVAMNNNYPLMEDESTSSSSSSSRSQSSEALNEDTESSDNSDFHYSPEGKRCTCTNNDCTDGPAEIFVNALPVAFVGDPHNCVRCKRTFYMTRAYKYVTNERCHYHWGKLQRNYTPADSGYASSDHSCRQKKSGRASYQAYACCGMGEGAPGCTRGKLHVWSGIEDGINGPYDAYVRTRPRRIAPHDGNYGIYAIDCEMCYTARGLELTKVTVVASDGRLVYDSLVRPELPIIDYNTRYSGITERDLNRRGANIKSLKDVQNDLMGFISADTILVGHGLENDLRALKIIHGVVVDTSIAFPHWNGLPYRHSLKYLVKSYLDREIQTSADGHNSFEDARACMELMLWKVRRDFVDQVNP